MEGLIRETVEWLQESHLHKTARLSFHDGLSTHNLTITSEELDKVVICKGYRKISELSISQLLDSTFISLFDEANTITVRKWIEICRIAQRNECSTFLERCPNTQQLKSTINYGRLCELAEKLSDQIFPVWCDYANGNKTNENWTACQSRDQLTFFCEYLICFGPKDKAVFFLRASPAEIEEELNTGASEFYTDGEGYLNRYAVYNNPSQALKHFQSLWPEKCV